jgi:DNA-directed RNA polymerase omega subunit
VQVIQNLPEGVDSKFRMVLLIARRAEQLVRGARPKIALEVPMKPTEVASREFQENLVRWDLGPEGGTLPGDEGEETADLTLGDES